jgi:hypothetical protein
MTTVTYYSLENYTFNFLTAPLLLKIKFFFFMYVNKMLFVKCNIKVIVNLLLKIYESQLTQLSFMYGLWHNRTLPLKNAKETYTHQ